MVKKRICSLCSKKDNFKLKYILPNFNIVQCKNCGLLTRDVIFNRKEIEKLYSQDYFCKVQKDYFSAGMSQELTSSLRFEDFEDRLKKIKKATKLKKGKIIDIGCATGVFLKIAKDNGWQPFGVEVSEYATKFTKKKFNIKVICGELQDARFKNDYFDVATGWDLIEHVEDPSLLMKEIRRVLKPNGFVALQTTMTDSLLFEIADILYKVTFGRVSTLARIAYPIHHSNHFSRDTLKKLFEENGFKVIMSQNVEMFYEETSLPKIFLPALKAFGFLSKLSGRTIELFIIGKKISN